MPRYQNTWELELIQISKKECEMSNETQNTKWSELNSVLKRISNYWLSSHSTFSVANQYRSI
jgi:hypothetical protein